MDMIKLKEMKKADSCTYLLSVRLPKRYMDMINRWRDEHGNRNVSQWIRQILTDAFESESQDNEKARAS
jgi:Arc/MetJ-type ribon-helix-helix transcriptional regulator